MARQYNHRQGTMPVSSRMDMNTSEQELMLKSWRRDGRTIALGAAAGVLVLVLMAVTAALLSKGRAGKGPREEVVTMADILGHKLQPRAFNATWVTECEDLCGLRRNLGLQETLKHILTDDATTADLVIRFMRESGLIPDTTLLYQTTTNNIALFDVERCTSEELIRNTSLIQDEAVVEYKMSADGKFLLVVKPVMPDSPINFKAIYDIIDLQAQSKFSLGPALDLAMWSPVGNALAYVLHNDIFYRPLASNSQDVRVTMSGRPFVVFNGVPDWSYREEILNTGVAMWFSPQGESLAFASFNDTEVGVVPIQYYRSEDDLYPQTLPLRYPKPGTAIPQVSIFVRNLQTGETYTLGEPADFPKGRNILIGVQWISNEELAVIWNNRLQNMMKVISYSSRNGSTLGLIYSQQERIGWLEPGFNLHFSENGSLALLVVGRQVVLLRRRHGVGSIEKALTGVEYVVSCILSWQESRGQLYFLGTTSTRPTQQHVYRVADTPGGGPPHCLSCEGRLPCQYAVASFSPRESYYMMECQGPEIPQAFIFNKSDSPLLIWDKNEAVRSRIVNKLLPVVYPTTVRLPGGHRALVRMWLPPNYDISKNKYPLLVHVHGAPGAVQINERFQVGWHTYLVANRSIVYVRIEGRGSQLVGQRARSSGHRRLGSLEVEDQILVIKELIQKYNYIDGAKVGIWGSSYGGYSALLALALDEDHVIKCGMAVSPIVSWRHYNALYTERYMHFPTEEDNLVGYDEADVSSKADRLHSKMVLLLHGTVDTKVHFHHSLKMARALRGNGVAFRFQIYPGEGHGLRGVRPHVFRAMEDFLEHCFPLD